MEWGGSSRMQWQAGNGAHVGSQRVSAHSRLSFPGSARLVDANLNVLLTDDPLDLREKLNRKRSAEQNGGKRGIAGRLGERIAAETSNNDEISIKFDARSIPENKGELCSLCGEICSSLQAHKRSESHRAEKTRQEREGVFQCNLCAKEFLQQGDFTRHVQSEKHLERKVHRIQRWEESEREKSRREARRDSRALRRRQKEEPLVASELEKEATDQGGQSNEWRKRKVEYEVNGGVEKRPARKGQELYSAAAASKRNEREINVGRKPATEPGQRRSLADKVIAVDMKRQNEQEAARRIQGESRVHRRQTVPEPIGSHAVRPSEENLVHTRVNGAREGATGSQRRSGAQEKEQREAAEIGSGSEEQGRAIGGKKPRHHEEDWLDLRLGLPEEIDLQRSRDPEGYEERWALGMQEQTMSGDRAEAAAGNGQMQQSRPTSTAPQRMATGTASLQNGPRALGRPIESRGRLIKGEMPRGLPTAGIDDEGFEVPEEVQAAVDRGADLPELAGPLNVENYFKRMVLLYHVEEAQMQLDILQFDQEVTPQKSGNPSYLMLFEVAGLAERKPSVAKGDKMILSRGRHEGAPRYLVYAHEVRLESRAIYTQSAYFDDGKKYTVRFTVRKEPIVRALRSLETGRGADLEGLLFPTAIPDDLVDCITPDFLNDKSTWDENLNSEQRQSVAVIVRWTMQALMMGPTRLMIPPIIIFGPPGTGKTKTLVEATFQALTKNQKSRILVCAPSNSAADNLLERMRFLERNDAIRINSASRPAEGVGALPAALRDFARYNERTGFYFVPPRSEMSTYRVFVTTCSASYLLAKAGFPRGYFSHIFIDEAGHAVEPDCIVPLLNFATRGTIVALAGDHQQLGPVVRSPLAVRHGFGVSYLERLCRLPLYSPTDEDGRYVGYQTSIIRKLLRNYRSHPSILEVPSEVLYEGELDACADEESRESLCEWRELPTTGFPIIFHGLETPDDHEEDSPSWFNDGEIRQVRKYVEKLTGSRRPRIRESEIGVIAPFRRQVQMLSRTFASSQITFGTVEDFQGQEMRVIILTTVRAERGLAEEPSGFVVERPRDIEADIRQGLGFLGNRKRFNVAVTRAKALLIIIGNPHVLKQDPLWARMLRFCISRGGYQDRDCVPPPLEELEDLSEGLAVGLACQNQAACQLSEHPAWPEPI